MSGKIKNLEEFAFFNRQLAGMLDAGIPLEGALEKLTRDMRKGRLKATFTRIGERLNRGESLTEAVAYFKNQLPPLYYRLCVIGEKCENLPSILTRLASYYRWQAGLKGRLKTLMFYPMVVMAAAIAVSLFLAFLLPNLLREIIAEFYTEPHTTRMAILAFLPYAYLGILAAVFLLYLLAVYTPFFRFVTDKLAWRFKASRYLQLANISRMFEALFGAGVPSSDGIALVEELNENRVTRKALKRIEGKTSEGIGIVEALEQEAIFPRTFTWILKNSGEQLAEGFGENAEIYGLRARRYMDICIYASVPLALTFVGSLVAANFVLLFQAMQVFLEGI